MDSFLDEAALTDQRLGVVQLNDAIRQVGPTLQEVSKQGAVFNAVLASGADRLATRMSSAFERFARTGKFSFEDLKNVALRTLDDIYNQAVRAGLDQLFSGANGTVFGGVLQAALTSFAPRAQGGPVAANRPYLIGENGPELFVPQQFGQVIAPTSPHQTAPVNITINMTGNAAQPAMRQSASQIASQVSKAVRRAQRNG